MNLTGKVYKVLPLQTFESGFTKRVAVIETDGEYPQKLPIEFLKDRTVMLDNITEGQLVTVEYDLRGSEWNDKFFLSAVAWKIDAKTSPSTEVKLNGDMAQQFNEEQSLAEVEDDSEILPF